VNTFLELMQSVEGVELGELEPMTTVLVWTWNSLYRVVVSEGSDVLVQGGLLFPQPTPAHVDGASTGGGAETRKTLSPHDSGWTFTLYGIRRNERWPWRASP